MRRTGHGIFRNACFWKETTRDKIDFIALKQIIRCQSDSNYTSFFLNTGKVILVTRTLKEFELALESCRFIRTHQSHLVNADHIKSLVKSEGGYLKMSDGSSVPISRARKDGVLKAIGAFQR